MAATRTVHLHGALRDQFGPTFSLFARDPAEALRGLIHMVPGFQQALADGHYRCVIGTSPETGRDLDEAEHLAFPWRVGERDFHLVPETAGAGGNSGTSKLIVGLAIVAIAIAAPYAMAALAGGAMPATLGAALSTGIYGGVTFGHVAAMGIAVALGGISMMLSPQPKVDLGSAESPEETTSFLFNGVTNTTEQGNPVPVVYGEVVTGCQQIAAGLAPEDYTGQAGTTNPTLTVLA